MKRRQFVKSLAVGTGLMLTRPRAVLGAPRGSAQGTLTPQPTDVPAASTEGGTVAAPLADGPTLLPSGQVLAPGVTPSAPDAPPPWWLLAPVERGGRLLAGWSIAEVSPVVYGGLFVTLRDGDGATTRVSICRRGAEGAMGLAHTAKLDLLLTNAGHGRAPTHEPTALAVAALARLLGSNEDERVDALPLMSCEERVRRFGPGVIL